MTTPALLVIAHGTRDPRGTAEMGELLGLLRGSHPAPVACGWLEDFASPSIAEAFDALVDEGVTAIGCVPLLNFAAYHANTDIPTQLGDAAARHPGVTVTRGEVLGFHPALLRLAARRVGAVATDPASEVLVVGASGSSNAEANSDVAKASRLLAETTGHRWVEPCFAGVTWPNVAEVLQRIAAAGARAAVLFSWSLLAGVLEQRLTTEATEAAADARIELAVAGRFGPDPLLAEAVLDRWHEAVSAGGERRPPRPSGDAAPEPPRRGAG